MCAVCGTFYLIKVSAVIKLIVLFAKVLVDLSIYKQSRNGTYVYANNCQFGE